MAITISPTLPILSAICLTFIQVILMNIARGESLTLHNNLTHHVSQWKSAVQSKRLRHAPPSGHLQLQIKYPSGEKTEVNWIKIKYYVANRHVPVITSSDNLGKNVMEDVGEFVIYHDVEKCSAVVYFQKLNALFGVIGLDYIITDLPYKFDANGDYPEIVEGLYLSKRVGSQTLQPHNADNDDPQLHSANTDDFQLRNADKPETPPKSCPCMSMRTKRSFDSDLNENITHHRAVRDVEGKDYGIESSENVSNIGKRQRIPYPEFYLEILVFVTSDVVEFFKVLYGENDHIQWVVRYYILYFNAVDMIFKKIPSLKMRLRINIAKIVIEDSSKPFEFLDNDEIQFSETTVKIREYLRTNQHMYPLDSFDHVFLSTRRTIIDESIHVVGITEHGADSYLAREQKQFYNAVPISIVGFLNDYSFGVYEISRSFNIDIDSWAKELEHTRQCNSNMQTKSSKCNRCLKWTENSKEQFNVFFRTNWNRCFLLNEPRSVRPSGPTRLVTALRQCRCFGYKSFSSSYDGEPRNHVGSNDCNSPLQCTKLDGDEMNCDYALRPFDGTACGIDKVCWDGKCTGYKHKRCYRKQQLLQKSIGRFV